MALVEWALTGTDEDGTEHWRPDLPANSGLGAWSSIDLRPFGIPRALVWMRDRNTALPSPGGRRVDLGNRLDTVLTAQQAAALTQRGIPAAEGQTLGAVLYGYLTARVPPDRDGRRRVRLGGMELGEPPARSRSRGGR